MLFLTGATGFVGSRLAERLAQRNVAVRCLVRDVRRANRLQALGFELVPGDVCNPESFCQQLAGCEQVIHLASVIEQNSGQMDAVNHRGTAALVEAAQRAGVSRFIHISSFGAAQKPRYAYAYSAWQAEQRVQQSGLEWVIFQPTVVVGKNDLFTKGFIQMARRWPFFVLPNQGKVRVQPLWVEDLVTYLLAAITSAVVTGRTLPVAGAQILSLYEIAAHIMRACNVQKPIFSLPAKMLKVGRRFEWSPWNSSYFLSKDHVIGEEALAGIERLFAHRPRPFSAVVTKLING